MRFNIKNILTKNKLFILVILLAAFLRLYKLEEFVIFLGDQGRDAIIIKRIITFEHFPAIGPISSVGGVFLGPFYYYLMAPFLLLTKLNPLGLALGSVILSLIGLFFSYLVLAKIKKNLARFFLILTAFSAVLVSSSRFSWNPNLLPFFSFFTLYFFYKFFDTKKIIYAFLSGVFYSLSLQLHYLALLIILPLAFFSLFNIKKLKFKNFFYGVSSSVLSFVLFSSPLIIFDLKHNFLNSRNFLKIFTQKDIVSSSSFFSRFGETIVNFFNYTLNLKLNYFVSLTVLAVLLIFFLAQNFYKKKLFFQINFLNFFLFLIGFSSLNSFRYPHYYGVIYLSFFLILTALMTELFEKKNLFLKAIVLIALIFWIYSNFSQYPFSQKEGNFQIQRAKLIAQSIVDKNPRSPYQVVPIPYTEMDGHIRYFLEVLGKRPLSEESSEQPQELYILCYEKECDALNHPQWQIAAFKNKKVADIWQVDRVKIYKIIHGK
jgi:4-amino-4-deoxy-L-arabinose transferase-like glycosyltransferase